LTNRDRPASFPVAHHPEVEMEAMYLVVQKSGKVFSSYYEIPTTLPKDCRVVKVVGLTDQDNRNFMYKLKGYVHSKDKVLVSSPLIDIRGAQVPPRRAAYNAAKGLGLYDFPFAAAYYYAEENDWEHEDDEEEYNAEYNEE
jgi:hypothetical protein